MPADNTAKITIRLDQATKRRFLAALALNGDTIQGVLSAAVADYLAKQAGNAGGNR